MNECVKSLDSESYRILVIFEAKLLYTGSGGVINVEKVKRTLKHATAVT